MHFFTCTYEVLMQPYLSNKTGKPPVLFHITKAKFGKYYFENVDINV